MEKALSLLEESLGSRRFQVQTFFIGHGIVDFQNGLQMYVITDRASEYSHLLDAISCGVGGIIAFPVLESDQPKYCCAVLELVTMEEKQDFDLETEKGFQALQCFSRVQRAEFTKIANVTRAVCQTHRLPVALTWIPCDYTWGAVDDISKSHVRLCNSGFLRTCELSIERTACHADEEMEGFVHSCEQLFLNTGQGAAEQACETCLPSFEPYVKEKHSMVSGQRSYRGFNMRTRLVGKP